MITGKEWNQLIPAIFTGACPVVGGGYIISLQTLFAVLKGHAEPGCDYRFTGERGLVIELPHEKTP